MRRTGVQEGATAKAGEAKKIMNIQKSARRGLPAPQELLGTLLIGAILLSLPACGAVMELSGSNNVKTSAHVDRGRTLFSQGRYVEAFQENQKALATGEAPADVALFNMGLISAHSLNPKKDYVAAARFFRRVVREHPQSPVAEQAQVWIQVLEEHQNIIEEKERLLEEKRTLTREKESLTREREELAQEKANLKRLVEKSRQIDLEIEEMKRQRRAQ